MVHGSPSRVVTEASTSVSTLNPSLRQSQSMARGRASAMDIAGEHGIVEESALPLRHVLSAPLLLLTGTP
jgi:hypothetical protein